MVVDKLQYYGINGAVTNWIINRVVNGTQRAVVDGELPEDVTVESGVPKGPLQFLLYFDDIGGGVSYDIRCFADDCI